MTTSWTFGRKLGAGFALIVGFALAIGIIGGLALSSVRDAKDRVIAVNAVNLADAAALDAALEAKVAAARRFLLDQKGAALESMQEARAEAQDILKRLAGRVYTGDSRQAVTRIERLEGEHQAAIVRVLEMRKTSPNLEPVVKAFDEDVQPKRDALRREVEAFLALERRLLDDEQRAASATAAAAMNAIVAAAVLAVLAAAVAAWLLTGTLSRQIGAAIQHVQSSSAELQAAASQQAGGAKEQATVMQEITTTMSELLATSRQIAESAQRVAALAGETALAARGGGTTVQKGQEASGGIKRQVDLIVGHMLELGTKAQQIGGILEIVGELAEQTNILAINATIEAAGAGEAGKRFAVVADEIRKLADRVGTSTKEIRGLIDETRVAVNTTVMATESGSKAVDLGTRQFGEVAVAFQQIAELVKTTTEAAREIELSTKQQATAVEQVNAAIGDVALTTRETEASSSQTLQTATQLTTLARDLGRFIKPGAAA